MGYIFGCLHSNSSVEGAVSRDLIGQWSLYLFGLTCRNPIYDQLNFKKLFTEHCYPNVSKPKIFHRNSNILTELLDSN